MKVWWLLALMACDAGTIPDGADDPVDDGDPDPDGDTGADDTGEPQEPGRTDLACAYGAVDDPLTAADLGAPGPYDVFTETVQYVDESREGTGNWWEPEGRVLDTKIWFPGTQEWWEWSAQVDGSDHPLVVYAHGFSSSRDEASFLGEHLASHGYIVVAPTFPLTNMFAPGGPDMIDTVNQPGDVSFVLDQMLARNALASDRFHGAIDADRIAVAGTSMGGMTTSLVTYHRTLRDPRVKAAVTLAGPGSMFDTTFYDHAEVPLLAVHGDLDAIVDYEHNARRTLDRAAPYVTLVTLADGSHTAFAPIPLEDLVLEWGGDLVAPEGSSPDNPDRLGCGVIAENMPEDASFIALMGGLENGMTLSDDPPPCDLAYLSQPALEPSTQRDLASVAVLAFLDAWLADTAERRDAACAWLTDDLADLPGVTVER